MGAFSPVLAVGGGKRRRSAVVVTSSNLRLSNYNSNFLQVGPDRDVV